jgi:Bacterial Ig-like domain (group 3)/Abnormal spindle-like microcephaly-assoc'd, ASPM-SPD-2-Hydin/Bacterial Ig-like domain (group 2)
MKNARKRRFAFVSSLLLVQVAMVLLGVEVAPGQQNPPLLQITSPSNDTVVNPGQAISVSVTSPANASFSQAGVVGEDPIGFSSVATSVPAEFSITIPTIIACRKFMLTAVGATSSGQSARSATILIDVERPDMPTAIGPQIPALTFKALGETFPLVLLAQFSDGSILDATESSYVTYSSGNTAIATVDSNGIVTGGSAGSTSITATYALNGQSVQTTIPVTVPPPVMSVSPVSLSFGSQNVGATSTAQQLTVTNTSNSNLKIVSVGATGDFSETDNCASSSPLPTNGTCTLNVTFTPTGTGARQGTVSISNGTISIASTVALSGTGLGQPTTTTTLTSSANPSILAASVTFTATVTPSGGSGTPTGTVTFSDGSTTLATQSLSNGQATFTSSSLTIGSHSITATYSGDSNFNGSTSATLTQSVQYEPVGTACGGDAGHQILQPINADGTSVFNQGQTVPAKFRVCDANGVSIGTSGVVSSFLLTQTVSGTVTTNVEDIVDTNNPDTAFRWDSTDQQWIFNISTQNLTANYTYVYTITVNDGTVINFQFGLK